MSAQITSTETELSVVVSEKQSIFGVAGSVFFLWQSTKVLALLGFGLQSLAAAHRDLEDTLIDLALVFLIGLAFVLLFAIAINLLRPLFGSRQAMQCTRDELELTSIDFGRVWRKRFFPTAEVGATEFGVHSISRYGVTKGLVFLVRKKRVKALRGLKAKEAQQILEIMRRLGFNVSLDPAMKMMIDLEESPGRFWWG